MILTKLTWQDSLLRLGWAGQRQDGDLAEERAQKSPNTVWSRESVTGVPVVAQRVINRLAD